MTFDFKWSSAFDKTVTQLMRAIRDEFPDGRVDESWLDENAGGSVNGRGALGRVLREAVKRGVVSVSPHQAERLAHAGSASHDDTVRDLLNAKPAQEVEVMLYSDGEIGKTLRSKEFMETLFGSEYSQAETEKVAEAMYKAFGWKGWKEG